MTACASSGRCAPAIRLRLAVTLDAMRRGIGKGQATATVDGKIAARGELMFAVGDAPA